MKQKLINEIDKNYRTNMYLQQSGQKQDQFLQSIIFLYSINEKYQIKV